MKGRMNSEYDSLPSGKDIRDSRKNNMDAHEKHANDSNTVRKKTSRGKSSAAPYGHKSS